MGEEPDAFGANGFLNLWNDKSSIQKPGNGDQITDLQKNEEKDS